MVTAGALLTLGFTVPYEKIGGYARGQREIRPALPAIGISDSDIDKTVSQTKQKGKGKARRSTERSVWAFGVSTEEEGVPKRSYCISHGPTFSLETGARGPAVYTV